MNWTTRKGEEAVPSVYNDPHLTERVLVHATGRFCVGGRPIEIGSEIRIERHVALSLEAQKKVVIVLPE
jgi:hypothetical protein